eukprot:UN10865
MNHVELFFGHSLDSATFLTTKYAPISLPCSRSS